MTLNDAEAALVRMSRLLLKQAEAELGRPLSGEESEDIVDRFLAGLDGPINNCGGKGGRPGPCPGAKRKSSLSAPSSSGASAKGFGHVKAAQGKIDKINATLAAAKLRVASIAKQLKDAKVNLKAVAAEVKRNVDALARRVRPGKGNPAAPPVVTAPPDGARIPSTVKTNPIAPRPGDEDYVGKPSHTGMFDLDIEEEMAVKSHK